MNTSAKIRVLIVDDSALVRRMLAAALAPERDIEVVGQAANAYIARDKVLELNPDVLTLDIEMPGMDGITFLKKLMAFKPIPVIVISSLGQAAAKASMDALRAGAVEILAKPHGPYSIGELGATLAAKIRIAAVSRVRIIPPEAAPPPEAALASASRPTLITHVVPPLPKTRSHASFPQCRVLAIGASTGGPGALATLLRGFPRDTPPILIVQHMPAVFTRAFAERLDRECLIAVKEAENGDELLPGRALVAPGDFHMTLRATPSGDRVWVGTGPPVCFSRPSVDVLFASIAEAVGKKAIAVLLTGMGADGARGMSAMRNAGAYTFAQNEESCVVFGMPKEAIALGAVDSVLPLEKIAPAVLARLAAPAKRA
jgi:two-component system chemotaxis response regulator CheB